MKTVFMIAPYFIPRRRVGAMRPYKFAVHLRYENWKPVICTIEDRNEQKTEEEVDALQDIEIVKLGTPFDRTRKSGAKQNRNKKYRVFNIGELFANWIDKQVPMDSWIFLFRKSYSQILKAAKASDPDVIWSTGDPWSGHWVGHKLSSDLSKPWIADFRDPWTLTDLNLRDRSCFSSRLDKKFEERFVKTADQLVFTSKQTEKKYREYFNLSAEKCATIYNSYHLPLKTQQPPEWNVKLETNKFHLIFFGRFRKLSPVSPVAKAVAEMPYEAQKKLRIHFFGPLDQEDEEELDTLNISDQFVSHSPVLPEQAPSVLQKADMLLLSTSKARKAIIPAKLWDYLITDKPILSITPNPEIGKILKETGSGVHFTADQPGKISSFLEKSIRQKEEGRQIIGLNRNPDQISRYSSKNTTHQLAQLMNKLVADE